MSKKTHYESIYDFVASGKGICFYYYEDKPVGRYLPQNI